MNIVITTRDRDLAPDLIGNAPFELTISGITSKGSKSLGDPSLYEIAISIGGLLTTVAVKVAAAWIYDKIKNRASKMTANGVEIQIEESSIMRFIETEHCKITESHTHKKINTIRSNG